MEAPNDRRGSHLSTRVLLNDDEYIDDESHNYLQSFEQNYEAGDHLRPLPAKSETTLSGVSGSYFNLPDGSRDGSISALSSIFSFKKSKLFSWSRAPSIEISPRNGVTKTLASKEEAGVEEEILLQRRQRRLSNRRTIVWITIAILLVSALAFTLFYVLKLLY